jgi:hypothetical protein
VGRAQSQGRVVGEAWTAAPCGWLPQVVGRVEERVFRRVVGAGVPLPLRSGLYWLLGNGGRQELWLVEQ